MNKKGITLIELIVISAIVIILSIIIAGAFWDSQKLDDYTYVIADGKTYETEDIKRIEDEAFYNGRNYFNTGEYIIIFKNGGRQKVSGYYFTNEKPKES